MMRETVRSLRGFFFLAGGASAFRGWELYQAAKTLGSAGWVFMLIAGVTLVIAAAYLVLSAILPRLLEKTPLIPLGVVALNLLTIVGTYAYLKMQLNVDILGWTIFGVLFNVYLLASLRRLSGPQPTPAS